MDLRKKILYTLFIIVIFRIGAMIPVPFLDLKVLQASMNTMTQSGSLLGYMNILSGGAFANATLFAMGVSPYINSSIIMQLLTVAIPVLERISKEGEEGRKKIAQITRYVTIALGLIQGTAYYIFLRNNWVADASGYATIYRTGWEGIFTAVIIVMVFTAGSALMMWLGEQINEKGIGNGISMILFAGIISRGPQIAQTLWAYFDMGIKAAQAGGGDEIKYLWMMPLIIIIFLAIIMFIVLMTEGERRIPVQYAKRVVGRKMYGGQSTHIPIKVNMSGVLPIIFASSMISVPGTIKLFIWGQNKSDNMWYTILSVFDQDKLIYPFLYFILIIAFAYFYVTIQYNPVEMANNLQKNNGTIPGIRPGKNTATFISKIINKITLIGALFLSVIAVGPIIFGSITKMYGLSLGGTSVLIIVGVAIETTRQIESQMLMRHYKGFLE